MATVGQPPATLDDLYEFDGKAELIGGRIKPLMPTGRRPNRVAGRIFRALDDHARAARRGEAYTDNMGFTVPMLPSGRESFSPDASYFAGPFPADDMRFIDAAPTFAVEVRSENDYGPGPDTEYMAKRVDYFAAGTLVVWDVDPVAKVISIYRDGDAMNPAALCRAGAIADAEPALSGWRVAVDDLFA